MQLLDELALLSIDSSYDDNKKVVDNSLKHSCVKFSWHLAKYFVSYDSSMLVFRNCSSLEFLDHI